MKQAVFILVIVFILGLFYGLGKQIYTSLQAGKRLDAEAANLADLQKKNQELKKRLVEVGSASFVEQQARDKLGLSRGGESVFIVPQAEIDKVLGETKQEVQKKIEPNFQGWLKLFIK